MNANELAEIIEHLENAKYVGASKAATMLRQQQAEITNLMELVDIQKAVSRDVDIDFLNLTISQQQAEIEALKLQLHTTLTNRDLRTYDGKLE